MGPELEVVQRGQPPLLRSACCVGSDGLTGGGAEEGREGVAAGAVARIPAGRMGTPQDMAGAALFLASPLADYIVGQTIRVDGGMTLA